MSVHMTSAEMVARVRRQLREKGCVCDAEIGVMGREGGTLHVSVAHDDWCPLLRVLEEQPERDPRFPGSVATTTDDLADLKDGGQ
jgi:hypothetical protein